MYRNEWLIIEKGIYRKVASYRVCQKLTDERRITGVVIKKSHKALLNLVFSRKLAFLVALCMINSRPSSILQLEFSKNQRNAPSSSVV